MALGKPYSIHKRGRIWYAQFKVNSTWSTARSTGQHAKGRAEAWCIDRLKEGRIFTREGLTLAEFAKDFFTWESAWAADHRASGKRLSLRYCHERTDLLNNRILPALGSRKLVDIDRGTVKDLRNALYAEGLAGNTINKTLGCLKTILESAEEHSLIRQVPRIDRAAEKPRQRGILTVEELRRLFAVPWPSFRAYVCNRVAACTGLRKGELLALTLVDIHGDYITVSRSWDERTKTMNATTKTGRARTVIVPPIIRQEIEDLAGRNPWGQPVSFLFYSTLEDKPMESSRAVDALYEAMHRIGISEEERRRRNVTFHSHRHFVNSILVNARVPLQRVQALTGHLTDEMTQRYYHIEDDLQDIRQIQEGLFAQTPVII